MTVSADPVPTSVAFEMTDAVARRAAREALLVRARASARWRDVFWLACSTALFVLVIWRGAHWGWWLSGIPTVLAAAAAAGWLLLFWRMPVQSVARLARLPHRRVEVSLGAEGVAFATANERLEVKWRQVEAIDALPGFWLFRIHPGTEIPVPRALLDDAAVAGWRARLETHSAR